MRSECIQAVSQALGRQITQAEAQKIQQKITEAHRRNLFDDFRHNNDGYQSLSIKYPTQLT